MYLKKSATRYGTKNSAVEKKARKILGMVSDLVVVSYP